jgi:hypothetical protein
MAYGQLQLPVHFPWALPKATVAMAYGQIKAITQDLIAKQTPKFFFPRLFEHLKHQPT